MPDKEQLQLLIDDMSIQVFKVTYASHMPVLILAIILLFINNWKDLVTNVLEAININSNCFFYAITFTLAYLLSTLISFIIEKISSKDVLTKGMFFQSFTAVNTIFCMNIDYSLCFILWMFIVNFILQNAIFCYISFIIMFLYFIYYNYKQLVNSIAITLVEMFVNNAEQNAKKQA